MSTTTPNLEFIKLTAERLAHYRSAPTGAVDFIEEQCVCKSAFDGGRTWSRPTLTSLQRETVLAILSQEHPPHTALVSWARKMGKTWLAACIVTFKVCCRPNELALVSGPTRDSARELGFTAILDNLTRNRALAKTVGADIGRGRIIIKATSSEVRAVARTQGSVAGADWTIAAIDELWAWTDKALVEHFRILTTPSPTRQDPLVLVTSYAPIKGRSTLLEQLLARAKRKEPGLYASIISGVDEITKSCPWVTVDFLRRMRATQPPRVFRRVFLNKPVADSDESDRYAFSRQQVQDCIDPSWQRQERKPEHARGVVVIGCDFAPKADCSAVAALCRLQDNTIGLLDLAAKHGNHKTPLAASWITEAILEMVSRFGPVKIIVDPCGLSEEIGKLRSRGFEVCEISHQGPKLADVLYRAIAGRRLRLYKGAGLVQTFDDRAYDLETELCNLTLDTEAYKIGHVGEGSAPGRQFDDRATSIGLALLAPELDLANSATMQGVSDFFPHLDGAQRIFSGRPPTFGPVIIRAPFGRDVNFGFKRNYF